MSRGTIDTNLASDTEAENTVKGRTSEYPSGFSATDAARENPRENKGLRLIVSMKSQKRNMMNMQTSKGFVHSQNMTSLSGIYQKIWLSTQMIISTNLSLRKIYRKAF